MEKGGFMKAEVVRRLNRAYGVMEDLERDLKVKLARVRRLMTFLRLDHFGVPILFNGNFLCRVEDIFVASTGIVRLDTRAYAAAEGALWGLTLSPGISYIANIEEVKDWKVVSFEDFPLYINFPYKSSLYLEVLKGGKDV